MQCIGILWNSMEDYAIDAVQEINEFASVEAFFKIDLGNHFENFMREIYGYTTPESEWKIEYKLKNSIGSYESRTIYILFIQIEIDKMDYVSRKKDYVPSSINRLKRFIREKYSRVVRHYEFDNVFHLTESEDEYIKNLKTVEKYLYAIKNDSRSKTRILTNGVNYE